MYVTGSYNYFKDEIVDYLKQKFPKGSIGLDMGCGSGKYGILLDSYFALDGVEVCKDVIFPITIKSYDRIYLADIKDFQFHFYNFIILGDVLEHLTTSEAQKLLDYILPKCDEVIIAVPFEYKQGIVDNNVYEVHKQDDLTPQLMFDRYPCLKAKWINSECGVYVKC